jgi:SOS response regulatory protein OraA/RecX
MENIQKHIVQNNKHEVLEAVKENRYALANASTVFRDDIDVVRSAISLKTLSASNTNGPVFQYASTRLRSDRKIVLEAVKNYGEVIEYVSPKFDDDKEVVLTALENQWIDDCHFGESIIYACISKRLRKDPDVVKAMGYVQTGIVESIISRISGEHGQLLKRREEDWQRKYGQKSKERLQRWNEELKR